MKTVKDAILQYVAFKKHFHITELESNVCIAMPNIQRESVSRIFRRMRQRGEISAIKKNDVWFLQTGLISAPIQPMLSVDAKTQT